MADMDDYTIEQKNGRFAVYGFGTYGRGSVLAGQTMKRFLDFYDTEAEAVAAYPQASPGYRSAHNTYGHLPGEDDPVPGGMYPDDIDDGY